MAAIATASKPRQLWPASHGQLALATASQPWPRPASQGTCGQPAKAIASQPAKAAAQPRPRAVGSKQPAVTFFFQNDTTITVKTLKGKTVTLRTNTCI